MPQREGGESLHDVLAGAQAGKALQQLLQHQARRDYRIAAVERAGHGGLLRALTAYFESLLYHYTSR